MTAVELLKFVTNHNCEYHWSDGEVYLFVDIPHIAEFNSLLGNTFLSNNKIMCCMKSQYFTFTMNEICEHFDIDPESVFTKILEESK